jgi:hypothetical protein
MRRLNVALTRARAALIVVGDKPTLVGAYAPKSITDDKYRANGEEEAFRVWKSLVTGLGIVVVGV